jgi:hypothetical protein
MLPDTEKNTEAKKTGKASIKITLRCVRVTNVATEKQYVLHIAYYECVYAALVIGHAVRMCRIMSSVVGVVEP